MAVAIDDVPRKSPLSVRLAQRARAVFWLMLVALVLYQVFHGDSTQIARDALLKRLQHERKPRVIALIHRQESESIFGVEVARYIDIEDSEAVLRAIRRSAIRPRPRS